MIAQFLKLHYKSVNIETIGAFFSDCVTIKALELPEAERSVSKLLKNKSCPLMNYGIRPASRSLVPAMRQKFMDTIDRMIVDAGEHVAEPLPRIYLVELASVEQ